MDRWIKKVAVVTGASSGIGAAIVVDLVKAGMIVIGLARRVEKVEELKGKIPSECAGELHSFKCDVQQEESVKAAFEWVEQTFGGIDVLVNNAGIVTQAKLVDLDNTAKIKSVIDTNIMGVYYCTRIAFHSMKKRDVDGHIIIINSVAGHKVPYNLTIPPLNMYPASKHAVTAMTELYRQEFQRENTKIKITSISPGAVRTEIMGPDTPEVEALLKDFPMLKSEDVSASVLYVLGTPPHVQVHELIIKPIGERI
ncbi:Farnesol dehydrogenase [Pseudolycoriella hygida]|uniref:Farnesol dehydrogenase n=1 Tax=Pseudolycoriella hygida TaxID=35572 RepID=A0A9Q0RYL5_9DIPT|nr:Farnesol dehydrogenase [Pseudolycoriella hygida]